MDNKKINLSHTNLLFENHNIFDAIKKLQSSKIKTLIIIDDKRKLIGTLTDGDLRRGILKGFNGNDKVVNIVNKNPIKKILNEKNINKKVYQANLILCNAKLKAHKLKL